jgi:glycosyltransferase involved in cell wall biosynthesis
MMVEYMSSPPVVVAVIPAYNEARRIDQTVRQVAEFVDKVIVVDDASTDDTARVAQEAGAQVVRQPANRGYIAAIKRGFAVADGDVVVTIDADGEYPADAIPALVAPIVRGEAGMVQAAREVIPRPSERFLNWLANWAAQVGDSGTGLRALRTDLAQKLEIRGACICGLLSLEVIEKGEQIEEIPIQVRLTDKRRRVAWFHLRQFFHLLGWLTRHSVGRSTAI